MDRSFLAIVAEGFFSRLSFGIVSFALPLYALHAGLSLTQVGFLLSVNTAVAMALKPATGHLADRYGLKPALTIAISLRSLVVLLIPFARGAFDLFAIKAAHGISKSLRDPAVNALIAERGGKKRIASAFAWYQTAKSVSGALGKGIAGVLLTLTASDYTLVFLAAFLLSAIPLFLVLFLVKEKAGRKASVAGAEAGPEGTADKENAATPRKHASFLLPVISLGFLLSVTAQMLHGLFPVLAIRYAGLSEAETGIILMAATVVTLLATPLFGWLSDHVSRKTVLLVRGFTNIVSSIFYMSAGFLKLGGVAAGNIADHVGKAAFRPAWGALMSQVSGFDRKSRARSMGLMSMGEDAGAVLGPIMAAFLWNTWGIMVMLGVRILLSLAAEIHAAIIFRSLENQEERIMEQETTP